ncbi:adenylyl-sulfate kinase [Salibacter halophilus]|jgi:adenylylsulfate kinase|uniref:Adenylyl-sulfate kinase n=1 Tax=Salibacter halophilus TaxID=1803916 RepID=A0A6N6MC62_9FLAO|nr:adenylyl-sulfate kinase [Salibacter halophilus]KAB1066123.1 adenylyl-sulfate kinase [Salibacter halophilus]
MAKEKLHIIPHDHDISQADREKLNGHKGLLIWFTGLSGSGKSTVANLLERKLYEKGIHTFILDGDNIRSGLNSDLDFSSESRKENIRRIGEVSNLFVNNGTVALSAFISPFRSDRDQVRNIVGSDRYLEIFVDCPLEVCEERDVKGLYKKARAGEISNFTGISSPFEAPENPDVHLRTDKESKEDCVTKIMDVILPKMALK